MKLTRARSGDRDPTAAPTAPALPLAMNILLCSVPYAPSVGGIETVTALLAAHWRQRGHGVTVATLTPAAGARGEDAAALRRPRGGELLRAVRDADVVVHNQISLRFAWPLAMIQRPWFIVHHTWIDQHGASPLAVAAKHLVLRAARNLSVSDALARALPVPSTRVRNPYDDAVFRPIGGVPRERDFVFVGRLVSDKGAGLLLQALARLKLRGRDATATIVGSGPEEYRLRGLVRQARLGAAVHFAGRLQGEELARTLNGHRYVVVPSMWDEPFGLVALEAQACGCGVVVADSGGLPEAAGPHAIVFPKGDAGELTRRLEACLDAPASDAGATPAVWQHLDRHRPQAVADAYLELFAQALGYRRAWT